MKRSAAILFALIVGSSTFVVAQPRNRHHSAEHNAAIQKCRDDYKVALRAAHFLKGVERKEAERKAKADLKMCIASAPR